MPELKEWDHAFWYTGTGYFIKEVDIEGLRSFGDNTGLVFCDDLNSCESKRNKPLNLQEKLPYGGL